MILGLHNGRLLRESSQQKENVARLIVSCRQLKVSEDLCHEVAIVHEGLVDEAVASALAPCWAHFLISQEVLTTRSSLGLAEHARQCSPCCTWLCS